MVRQFWLIPATAITRAILVAAAVAAATACRGKADPAAQKVPAPPPPPAARGPTLPMPAPGAPLGIPECDTYRDKLLRCLARLTPDAAGPARRELDATWIDWQSEARWPQGRVVLVSVCKSALDASRAVYTGCEL
jgi:hypothetical protein